MVLKRGLSFSELPEWKRENSSSHIRSHYRLGGSYWECIYSLFWFHNETWNAWTMIISNLIGTILICYTLVYYSGFIDNIDKFIFLFFWFHGMAHLPFSVGNHIFGCIGKQIADEWQKYDFIMICVASDMLIYILSFYVFNINITLLLTFIGVIMTYYAFSVDYKDKNKSVYYVGIHVLLYSFPVIYQSMVELYYYNNVYSVPFYCILCMIISLGVGAFTYSYEFPQRYSKTGRFDIFFNGHNIMHFGVMTAYLSEYTFLLYMVFHDKKRLTISTSF